MMIRLITPGELPSQVEARLHRILRNAVMVLGGGVVSAVLALGASAVAIRALEPSHFGVIVIAQAFALLVERIGTFQSWQALIRFGSQAMAQQDLVALRGLLRIGAILDAAAGAIAAVIGAVVALIAGAHFGWSNGTTFVATWYALSVALRATGTSLAVLRLSGGFATTAFARSVGHLVRLLAALAAWASHAGWPVFAAVWIVADMLPPAVMAIGAFRHARRLAWVAGERLSLREVKQRFPELAETFVTTSLHSTVKVVVRDVDVLVAGALLGSAAAAIVRIARQLGSAAGQLADPFMQAIYPELAGAASHGGVKEVRAVVKRSLIFGIAAGAVVVTGTWLLAEPLLNIVAGRGSQYTGVIGPMRWSATGQAMSLATVPVSPALLALGHARGSFGVLVVATAVHAMLLFPLVRLGGTTGAGIAYAAYQMVWAVLAVATLRRVLHATDDTLLVTPPSIPAPVREVAA